MVSMMWAVGLMSGTSLDGIDAALVRTDGVKIAERGPWITEPFDGAFLARLRESVYGRGDILQVEHELTLRHAEAVKKLLAGCGFKAGEIGVIGFHGQTVAHRPAEGITWQIGDGALLAERMGIPVVNDFRRRDMAAGGQGAPLVPLYHAALAMDMDLPIVVLNIGGIGNVSWIGRSEEQASDILALDILAFDTGPGNVLLNEWAFKTTGWPYDKDGALARAGVSHRDVVEKLLADPFFALTPPKSLDRNHFTFDAVKHLSREDGAATLTEFTAASIKAASQFFPVPAKQWFVSGGGRHNPAVMQALRNELTHVYPVEELGWEGDALEAQAFAYLAVRSLRRLPLSLPTTTGANRAVTGGAFYTA